MFASWKGRKRDIAWAGSLVGRAQLLHSWGREFESLPVHKTEDIFSDFCTNPLVREGLYKQSEKRLFNKWREYPAFASMGKYGIIASFLIYYLCQQWMPRRFWPKKDVDGDDTRRGGAINLWSDGFRMGQPILLRMATHQTYGAICMTKVWLGTAWTETS